jgi:hypothetical protein
MMRVCGKGEKRKEDAASKCRRLTMRAATVLKVKGSCCIFYSVFKRGAKLLLNSETVVCPAS